MKYLISKINRTIELDDKLVQEFSKYDELRDSIFTILLRSKYKNGLSESNVSGKELSSVSNEILLTELKAIADLPAALETYINSLTSFKKTTKANQCNMIINAYDIPIEITDKNLRIFRKMHNADINSTDIEMYLDAYYHMKPNVLISTVSPQELSATVNNSIQKEATCCYSVDFYKEA